MIAKVFGVLDIIAGITLILLKFSMFEGIGWIAAIYLVIKGIIFLPNIVSVVDIVSGIFIGLAMFGIFNVISWIVAIWLIQKGIFSLFS